MTYANFQNDSMSPVSHMSFISCGNYPYYHHGLPGCFVFVEVLDVTVSLNFKIESSTFRILSLKFFSAHLFVYSRVSIVLVYTMKVFHLQ